MPKTKGQRSIILRTPLPEGIAQSENLWIFVNFLLSCDIYILGTFLGAILPQFSLGVGQREKEAGEGTLNG